MHQVDEFGVLYDSGVGDAGVLLGYVGAVVRVREAFDQELVADQDRGADGDQDGADRCCSEKPVPSSARCVPVFTQGSRYPS